MRTKIEAMTAHLLRNYYSSEGLSVCKRFPDRSKSACQRRALRLGLTAKSK